MSRRLRAVDRCGSSAALRSRGTRRERLCAAATFAATSAASSGDLSVSKKESSSSPQSIAVLSPDAARVPRRRCRTIADRRSGSTTSASCTNRDSRRARTTRIREQTPMRSPFAATAAEGQIEGRTGGIRVVERHRQASRTRPRRSPTTRAWRRRPSARPSRRLLPPLLVPAPRFPSASPPPPPPPHAASIRQHATAATAADDCGA